MSGDTNGKPDVFLHDRWTGETERVSVASDGTQGNESSGAPAVSADGRYVAFWSAATTLVAGDTNSSNDVFVHDRQTGTTTRVSVASAGTQSDGNSWEPDISADGRYVAFYSQATNLVAGDTNGKDDVFVHDRQTGATERVSVASDGTQGNWNSWGAAISADGRYVAFHSLATVLVSGDTNGKTDVFLRDRQTATTERISISTGGVQGDENSSGPRLSADGRYVAFQSPASTLVPADTNERSDCFVRDRQLGITDRVSVASDGSQANYRSQYPEISGDGRYVVFRSLANNLVSDGNNKWDIFLHDRETLQTSRVSVSTSGTEANGDSGYPHISSDGRYIVFQSLASNLVSGDTNAVEDVFVRERLSVAFTASPTSGVAPLMVSFSDLSTGGPTSWEWDFDDGATSTAQNPTHEYADPGSYTITLTVGDGAGTDSETKANYITVEASPPPPPDTDFSGTPTTGTVPLTVEFTDLSTGAPTVWSWAFGDGGTSTAQNPTHEYIAAGSYSVSLTALNLGGSDTETKTTGYIAVSAPLPPAPTADFLATPVSGTAPLTVEFGDLSTNDPTSWSWEFGDGGTSSEQSPSHEYESAGMYTVSLTAGNAGGSDTETKANCITVTFADADLDDWACEAILACVNAGIVSGYGGGTYHPDWPVDRGQMGVYIARAVAGGDDYVPDGPATPTFMDVPNTGYGESGTEPYWAYKYIEHAVAEDVIQGYEYEDPEHPGETLPYYEPLWNVTRDQMAVYVARARGWVGLGDDMTTAPELFPDVPAGFWSGTAIEACVTNGVVQGYLDGCYHPEYVVTRDQMAVYVARAFDLVP